MAKVDEISSYPIVPGQFNDAEEDDTVEERVHSDGGEKSDVFKEFFGYNEGAVVNPTHSGYFSDGDKLMTNGDNVNPDWVEEPAVDCGGETSGTLFRRCFALMGIKIVLPMDGSVRRKSSVDAFTEMTRNAAVFKSYGRSRIKIQGPDDNGLYKVKQHMILEMV